MCHEEQTLTRTAAAAATIASSPTTDIDTRPINEVADMDEKKGGNCSGKR